MMISLQFLNNEYKLSGSTWIWLHIGGAPDPSKKDPMTGTDQKAAAFWTRVHIQYNKTIAEANKNHENNPEWRNYLMIVPRDH